MLEIIINALLLGFSTGLSCLTFCTPFFLPYILSEERKIKANFWELIKFFGGRLTGYLAFGLILGYLGQQLNVGWVNVFSTVSLAILSLLIILYGFNFFKINFCGLKLTKVRLPFWIGLLTGVNICPPFLLALNYIFILGNITQGIIYFFFFFLATNVYFIPLIFLGRLSYLEEFKKIARYTLIIIGGIYFTYALYSLLTNQAIFH
ncbi:MAG: sulfite exporter TauE/SafE family protein [Candidatus Falkowbacteria bacterium]|nr:sulfite exporter TauE/SafE family protein [Candidatus Falkowbacteria bacterium]